MLLHMQKYDYTIWYKPGKDMVLADHLSCFPSQSNNLLPIPIAYNVQHSSFLKLNWTSFEASLNGTQCIALSTASPFEVGLNASRTSPILPDTSGALGMNSPLNMAYSSRGQGYAFPRKSLTVPLLTCMGLIKASIGCKLRWGWLCIGQA